jgi:stearoyl-CoA desaturase (delta-9 desaturase)
MSPRFAARWWEIDPTYYVIVVLDALGVIKIATSQRARYPLQRKEPSLADAE